MYEKLLEAWKKEKENLSIQLLPRGFYLDLASYIKKIKEERRMIDEKTVKGRLLQQEEEKVQRMTEELVQIRYEKMIRAIMSGETIQKTAITEEEEELYKNISAQVESYQSFIKKLLFGKLPQQIKKNSTLSVVRFLKETPEIVGTDMKTYGPFKPEDIASLPKENAKSLIKEGVAIEVEM